MQGNRLWRSGFMAQSVARLLRKWNISRSNPTVGIHSSYCVSFLLCVPCSSSKLIQMQSTMIYTKPYPVLDKDSIEKIWRHYGGGLWWFITFNVSFKQVHLHEEHGIHLQWSIKNCGKYFQMNAIGQVTGRLTLISSTFRGYLSL